MNGNRPADMDEDGPLYAPAKRVYPQSVAGRFRRIKWVLLIFCLGVYYTLPFIRWDRGPYLPSQAVMVDFERKRLFFFFIELWPQEVFYLTGLLILAALILFLMNAIAGRIWCGYLCPQTVWTDLFMAVERLIEGDRRERIRRDEAPWTAQKLGLKAIKHVLWLMIAWWTGGAWVLYFGDAFEMVKSLATLTAPLSAYIWIGTLTITTYALAGHMREQVCLYMCPWPRIQAALTDAEARNVTYKYDRGDPRISLKQSNILRAQNKPAGDCIDCNQCVAVCPTGIDIRDGAQLGCIQCGLCIDACDSVMTKINRPLGLIGYDTEGAVEARAKKMPEPINRVIRPRTILYAAIIAVVGGIMLYELATRQLLAISVNHERSPLFVTLRDGSIRNSYLVRISNKRSEPRPVALDVISPLGATIEVVGAVPTADWRPIVTVGPDQTFDLRLLVSLPRSAIKSPSQLIQIKASDLHFGETARVTDHFFSPEIKP